MVGVKGTYKETLDIKNKINSNLGDLGFTLSESKTKITNLNKSKVSFLGTNIFRARSTTFARVKVGNVNILRRNSRKLRLEAPMNAIISKLHEANFMRSNES